MTTTMGDDGAATPGAIAPLLEGETALLGTPEELAYELRAAEGSIWTGTRLAIGIGIFSLASLAFAYFYLRSSNSEQLWRPHDMTAPTALGAAIMAVMVASAGMAWLSSRFLGAKRLVDFQVAGWIVVFGAVLSLGMQIYELTQLPFFPGASGYSSCFIGWAAMNIVTILAGLYWTETLLARHMRLRRALVDEGSAADAPLPAERLFRANVDGSVAFWAFIATAEVFFWILFYVI